MLTLKDVSLQAPGNGKNILSDINLTIKPGEVILLTGRNGSGKSSLLKILAGRVPPSTGELSRRPRLRTLWLSQDAADNLCLQLTVAENFRLYQGHKLLQDEEISLILQSFLPALAQHIHTPVGVLSGGQKQCLLLALALNSPVVDLLLLDEHTSALDDENTKNMMAITLAKAHEKRIACVIVSHEDAPLGEHLHRHLTLDHGRISTAH